MAGSEPPHFTGHTPETLRDSFKSRSRLADSYGSFSFAAIRTQSTEKDGPSVRVA